MCQVHIYYFEKLADYLPKRLALSTYSPTGVQCLWPISNSYVY